MKHSRRLRKEVWDDNVRFFSRRARGLAFVCIVMFVVGILGIGTRPWYVFLVGYAINSLLSLVAIMDVVALRRLNKHGPDNMLDIEIEYYLSKTRGG